MTTGVKPLTIIGSLDYMITFSDPVITPRDYLLFHWFDHRFDELVFFICQVVLINFFNETVCLLINYFVSLHYIINLKRIYYGTIWSYIFSASKDYDEEIIIICLDSMQHALFSTD